MTKDFLTMMQKRTAELAIGPSTLRNQGAPGAVASGREFLKKLDLGQFKVDSAVAFKALLNEKTENLRIAFPMGAQSWGAARKALNIFLRDILYNHYLREEHAFLKLEPWLEVPLDSQVAAGLSDEPEGKQLRRWQGVKHLTSDVSENYQNVAERVARRNQVARVHLDVIYWRGKRE